MHIAIGYSWYPNSPIIYLEQALCALGHQVTYVGTSHPLRPGFDQTVSVAELIHALKPKPDLYLWVDPVTRYFPAGIEELEIPTAGYLVDVHLGPWRTAASLFFDTVLVTEADYMEMYRQHVGHSQVVRLPLAVSETTFQRLDLPRIYDVAFVGHRARAHQKTARMRHLQLITQRYRTNDVYRTYTLPEINQVYNQAKIVINTSISGGVTMRMFEGTACGALVLTDTRPEAMGDTFEFGKEMIAYRDDPDLIEKIDYYLAHEEERMQIAQNGCEKTHKHHTWTNRAKAIVATAIEANPQKCAPMRKASAQERFRQRKTIYTSLYMLDALADSMRTLNYNPVRRFNNLLPCLVRRLLR